MLHCENAFDVSPVVRHVQNLSMDYYFQNMKEVFIRNHFDLLEKYQKSDMLLTKRIWSYLKSGVSLAREEVNLKSGLAARVRFFKQGPLESWTSKLFPWTFPSFGASLEASKRFPVLPALPDFRTEDSSYKLEVAGLHDGDCSADD
ncbi:uncharacterized protein LOC118182592 isoform X1 [Stegodyphus dumicola]|uniref:uncharacterized protein LOC118182592 isoform X1 n=1 Tax=Stegodyphus dumicola TaxID=202533 RepID=UPI0015AAA584|nr:uncharacterized protein LOC118182592 isoform X1 [Stegodyphus dumicola]